VVSKKVQPEFDEAAWDAEMAKVLSAGGEPKALTDAQIEALAQEHGINPNESMASFFAQEMAKQPNATALDRIVAWIYRLTSPPAPEPKPAQTPAQQAEREKTLAAFRAYVQSLRDEEAKPERIAFRRNFSHRWNEIRAAEKISDQEYEDALFRRGKYADSQPPALDPDHDPFKGKLPWE
jgi:hypothetical protein